MNRTFVVYLVSFAAFMGPFTQTIYTPIIPEVTSGFHTTPFLVNLTISIFTIGLALMQIVYGPLTDAGGRRRVMLAGVAIYTGASVGCFLSPAIGVLLVFRALQAVGIAAGSVVAVTVIGDLFEGSARGRAMGTFQTMVALGPVVGPIVGGFLGGRFEFHAVFLALAIVGLVVLAGNMALLRETKPDKGGAGRFAVRDFATVLKDRVGSAVILLGFVQYYAFYNFLVFLPAILSDRYGLSAEQKGLVFLPMSLLVVVGSFIGGRMQGRFPARKVIVVTASLNAAAILLFLLVYSIALPWLVAGTSLFGLLLGMSLPVQTTLLTETFPARRATATGVYNFFRYMGMACGPLVGSAIVHWAGYRALYLFADLIFVGCAFYLQSRLGGRVRPSLLD